LEEKNGIYDLKLKMINLIDFCLFDVGQVVSGIQMNILWQVILSLQKMF